ncbi:MAG: hypothetical protein Q8K36_01690, partial [Alphaproteobacteria bacterium]|nr:hypothetical protein [Alphaproteobacteria bacterium]
FTQQTAPESDLSEQKSGNYAVRIGKKITDATEVFVEQGAVQGTSKLAIDTQITDNLSFEAALAAPQKSDDSEFNKTSSSSAGLVWAKRY